MATIKSFTDISQSKKLAEILPHESADMCYIQDLLAGGKYGDYKPYIGDLIPAYGQGKIRCWSLTALLNYLREIDFFPEIDADKCEVTMNINYYNEEEASLLAPIHNIKVKAESFIDACYEMILKLHEQKVL